MPSYHPSIRGKVWCRGADLYWAAEGLRVISLASRDFMFIGVVFYVCGFVAWEV